MPASSGSLPRSHQNTTPSSRPSTLAADSATGPVRMIVNAAIVAMTRSTADTPSIAGRMRQNGRPSSTS